MLHYTLSAHWQNPHALKNNTTLARMGMVLAWCLTHGMRLRQDMLHHVLSNLLWLNADTTKQYDEGVGSDPNLAVAPYPGECLRQFLQSACRGMPALESLAAALLYYANLSNQDIGCQ